MRVYVVRHGKAVDGPQPLPEFPRPHGYPTDWDRPISARGAAQAEFLGATIREQERRLAFILSSPYPRALQTARLIARAIGGEVRTRSELEVDRPVSDAITLIDEYRGSRAIMLVGHNPQLGNLIGVLSAGLPGEELVLKTGELVGLDLRTSSAIGSARVAVRFRLDDSADAGNSADSARRGAA